MRIFFGDIDQFLRWQSNTRYWVVFLSAASVFFWEKKQFFTLIYKKIGNTLKPGTPLTKCQIPKRVGHRHCKVGHRHCKVSTLLTYGQNCSFFWYPSNAVSEPEAQRDFNWSELFFFKKRTELCVPRCILVFTVSVLLKRTADPSNAVSEPEAQRDFNWSELFFFKKEHSLKEHSGTSPSLTKCQTLKNSGTSIQNCSFLILNFFFLKLQLS